MIERLFKAIKTNKARKASRTSKNIEACVLEWKVETRKVERLTWIKNKRLTLTKKYRYISELHLYMYEI